MHGLVTLNQRIVNLTRTEAHALTLYAPEHFLMTKAREKGSLLPSGLEYTHGTGGVLKLIDGLGYETLNIVKNFFQDSKDQFITKGYDHEVLEKGYKHGFAANREKVSERVADGVSGNIALAIGCDKVLNQTLEQDFNRLHDNTVRKTTISGSRAAADLDVFVLTATEVRAHTNTIRAVHKKRYKS